jgi:chorismate-pyruvate lyase
MKSSASHAMTDDMTLTPLQKVLLLTDGTMTQFLEAVAGETIRVQKLEQRIVHSGREVPEVLRVSARQSVLMRTVLLRGTNDNYAYARSVFVLDRLPAPIRDQMFTTDRPVGQLLRARRMETYRELIAWQREKAADLAQHFSLPPTAELLSRTCVVYHDREPLSVITEKFPADYLC